MCINGHPTEVINGRVICPTCAEAYKNRANRNRRINQAKRAQKRATQNGNTNDVRSIQ